MMRGGVADKLGNDYEAHWTLIEALRVLQGLADEIRVEAFNEDATGFEFRVTTGDQSSWHQCKRRRVSGSWTLGALSSEGVLSAFARKLADRAECVFVSADPAGAFKGLADKARLVASPKDFRDALSKTEQLAVQELENVWPADSENTFAWLRRCRIETVSEHSLLREATSICRLMFVAEPEIAIERLIAFLDRQLTRTITTEAFRAAIDSLDLGWKAYLDETLDEKLRNATDEYLASILPPVAGGVIATPDIETAVELAVGEDTSLVVIGGGAGGGKSIALSKIVAAARGRGWPTLALRIDRFLSAQTVGEIGRISLGRDENPVGVLGNRHGRRPTLFVIDQLDAVSEASGRSGRIRDLLFRMISDSHFYPNMRVVVACRSYDIGHDGRLKQLADSPFTRTVELKPLNWGTAVEPVLTRLGVDTKRFSEHERHLLSVPIHLRVFAELLSLGENVAGELSGSRLFDNLVEVRAREFREAGIQWTPQSALGSMAQSMSNNQELTAPEGVLSPFPGAVDALASAGLITAVAGKLQFAHESFFDHVFSSQFVASGKSVVELLKTDEQRLFRRTQVRQIFSRLRDQGNRRQYLRNLREVLESPDVRFLVKDAVAYWLRRVEEPTEAELNIVTGWYSRGHPLEMVAKTALLDTNWTPLLLRTGTIATWIERGGEEKTVALWLLRRCSSEHAKLIEPFLRHWWGGDEGRAVELIAWFSGLYPNGSIGPLEDLYREVIDSCPLDKLHPDKFDNAVSLGSWVHTDRALGARVFGYWLARWMAAFPDRHPFGEWSSAENAYWVKELVEHEPEALLDAILPSFVEALTREARLLDTGVIDYPTIRVPLSEHDSPSVWTLIRAFERLARENPDRAAQLLDVLPSRSKPALLIHLKAIAANGEALGRRLLDLVDNPNLFDIGQSGGEWTAFAYAARSAFPHMSAPERQLIERRVLKHQPEQDWLVWCIRRRKAGDPPVSEPDDYIRHLLSTCGETQRAILQTIGSQLLSSKALARLAELDRKFPSRNLPEAYGIRGGMVESPISMARARKMSDRSWLNAFAKYQDDERHIYLKNSVIGGARQLSSVLQACVKTDPPRFVALLERMPETANPTYAEGILTGLCESGEDGELAVRAIIATRRWPQHRFGRTISWTLEKHPSAARNESVLKTVLHDAEFGDASDTTVTTTSSSKDKPPSVQELLWNGGGDFESSGLNNDRGAAYRALANILWDDAEILSSVTDLVDRRIEAEPLTSVRMMMLHTIHSVAKHDLERGLRFLERLAERDPRALRSHAGQHMLGWATYNSAFDSQKVIDLSLASQDPGQRALGLLMESGLAISDDARDIAFRRSFAEDPMRRQVAAYRAAGNVTSDRVGDRAMAWLEGFFDDENEEVRREAAHLNWDEVLDGNSDRTALVLRHIQSRSFEENSDNLFRALEERVDRFPEITFATVRRVLDLMDGWKDNQNQGHWSTMHHLSGVLVELYRAVDGDSDRERELLDLFDRFLARENNDIRDKIGAYERH
ncbi:hypothetical protein AZC_2136 [Azorhizobium caulinodans ORS 571]|uniref:ATP-binding protein n=2 Tax=Azorhizobium caulinodans TaxID=7 RepID=A8I7L7_AZOC5|nr:hypothetical protein AZC_2136 [Azorhizobium caulinodans ORS 571]